MGHHWEKQDEAIIPASVEDVWNAIATGPGIDSWFMGRSSVEPGPDGAVRTDMGAFTMDSAITGWEPLHRLAHRSPEDPDGGFIAFEYLIEGRGQGSTVLRVVTSGFLPGDDWEDEFEAMTLGGAMYFGTLIAYLTHFAGRTGRPITVTGPPVSDWPSVWADLHDALGLSTTPQVGDPAGVSVPGLPEIEGVLDFVNPQALGIRTPDGLYRFIHGYFGSIVLGHHLFAPESEPGDGDKHATAAWEAWLAAFPQSAEKAGPAE
jgi:uncharacterized protein YndB with AHSA1/START domain